MSDSEPELIPLGDSTPEIPDTAAEESGEVMAPGKYGWSTEANMLAARVYYDFPNFMRILLDLTFIRFSVKAERDRALLALRSLPKITAVSPNPPSVADKRFPEHAVLIELEHPVIAELYTQLVSALDFSDRYAEKGRGHADGVEDRLHSNFEDSKRSYYTALRGLMTLSHQKSVSGAYTLGIWNRDTFERTYRLVWTP